MTSVPLPPKIGAATRRIWLENYLKNRPLVRISGGDLDRENKHVFMPYPSNDASYAVICRTVIEGVSAIGKPKIVQIPMDGSYNDILESMLKERGLPNQFKKNPPEIDIPPVFGTRAGFINAYEVGDTWLRSGNKRYASAHFYEISNVHVALRLFEEQLDYHNTSLDNVVMFLEQL